MWLECIGVVSGCFPHITCVYIPTALVSALFLQQHPYFFFHFVKIYIDTALLLFYFILYIF